MRAALRLAEEEQHRTKCGDRRFKSEPSGAAGRRILPPLWQARNDPWRLRTLVEQYQMMGKSVQPMPSAVLATGDSERSAHLFADAERRQQRTAARIPFAVLAGRLLALRPAAFTGAGSRRARSGRRRRWSGVRSQNWVRDIALDTFTLGRAHLALALKSLASGALAGSARGRCARCGRRRLNEAVEGLRAIRRTCVDRSCPGLWPALPSAAPSAMRTPRRRDLDEVEEIAEPGPMRLYLCDIALERARLALGSDRGLRAAERPRRRRARRRPLCPTPPRRPRSGRRRGSEVDAARKLIAKCGYHRRDEELSERRARRPFAGLPPGLNRRKTAACRIVSIFIYENQKSW